jgi:hypothetical protein
VTDVAALDDGLSLLEEISQTNTHSANAAQADPTGGALPLEAAPPVGGTTHTIPLKQSHEKADTPPSSLE